MMKRLALLAALFVLGIGTLTSVADARGPFLRIMGDRYLPQHRQYDAHHRHHYNRYDRDQYYLDLYPKYYGAFHSREILTYGYPSGDLGFRGFPW